MFKKVIVIFVVIALMIGLPACSGNSAGGSKEGYEKNTITIAHQRDTVFFSLITLVIREQGLLENYLPEGVSVEWTGIDVQTDMRDALVAGQLDFGILPTSQLIIATSSGLPLVPVAGFIPIRTGLYSHDPNVKNVDDIVPGNKISSASFGNASHTALQIFCLEHYGDAQHFDDNIAPMSYADMFISVDSSNDLTAALIAFADSVRADESDNLELILDLTPYVVDNCLGSTALVTESFYQNNPVFIEAYRSAAKDAVEFVLNNPSDAAVLLSEFWEFDTSIIEQEINDLPPSYEISESGFDSLANFMYDMGVIKDKPKMLSELSNYQDIPKN